MSQPNGSPTGKNADVPKTPEEFLIAYLKHTSQMIQVATDPEEDDQTSHEAALRIGACVAVSYLASNLMEAGHAEVIRNLLLLLNNPHTACAWVGARLKQLGVDVDADTAP